MRQNIRFPYNVFKRSVSPDFEYLDNDYIYKLKVPDIVFSFSGIMDYFNDIDDLITNSELTTELNCSATMYRKCFISDEIDSIEVKIPRDKVRKRFSLDTMIIATDNLSRQGAIIEKGMPLAHLGTKSLVINDRKQSLFTFQVAEDGDISYSYTSDSIIINLPEKEFFKLKRYKDLPLFKDLIASQLGQIALLQACNYLKEGSSYSHTMWYNELLKRWRRFDNSEDSYPEVSDYLNLINDILKDPSLGFIKTMINNQISNRNV